jgi:hypothetical protein
MIGQTEQTEQTEQLQTIKLNNKTYKLDDLGDHEMGILSDIKLVDGELKRVELQKSITTLAKAKLYDELNKALEKFEPIQE